MREYFPLVKNWPEYDTALTVFRYAIVRELCRGKRVLEIGAASGEGTVLLADMAKEIVALDYQNIWDSSPAAKLPNVRFVCQDALSMLAEWAGCFDVVIAMELIEHLDDFDGLQKSVFNVLSKDGVFVLSTPNFDIYSDRGDSSRKPVYEHHHHEYCAKELERSFLNCWKSKEIMGLSQLSSPNKALASEISNVLLYLEKVIYLLELGTSYPQYKLFSGGSLSCPLPLEFCQSFITLLFKGAPVTVNSIFPGCENIEIELPSLSDVAFQSARTILQRRNQQVSVMSGMIDDLNNIVKNREDQIKHYVQVNNDLTKIVKNREEQIERLSG
ncbi:MAG: class I SAM-dependent methyltransferase [Phycisphaerae bacterium]|jgi:2-polyprenyl-3-methyl-5-hydroxy-6-metoxy-1,4-benzoquinol methylase